MKKVAIALLMLLSACSSEPETTVTCTVLSHNVLASQYGTAHYHTMMSCDDGYYHDVEGMNPYNIAVGTKVSYSSSSLR